MLQEERFSQIIAFIQGKKRVTLDELAKLTGVSAGTVRRDVKKLEESGVLTLVRGGVALRSEGLARQSFDLRNIDNKVEKQQLAQLVSEVVFDGQTIALNSGTTNLMIADFLVSHYRNLTVITNNLRIINILKAGNNFTLVLPCGIFDPEEYSVIGSRCEAEILNYAPDAVLLAVNALSLSKGVTDFRLFEAGIAQSMLRVSKTKIVVADHTKFDRISCMKICDISDLDYILTDELVTKRQAEEYEACGVRVLTPKREAEKI